MVRRRLTTALAIEQFYSADLEASMAPCMPGADALRLESWLTINQLDGQN
jgi:hypothetical protein